MRRAALGILIIIILAMAMVGCGKIYNQPEKLSPEVIKVIDKGLKEIQEEHWIMAINYFQEALYSAPLEPALLFNTALAYDKSEVRPLNAIAWYRAYMALKPKAVNFSQVRQRVAVLEEKVIQDARKLCDKAKEIIVALPDEKTDSPIDKVIRAEVAVGDLDVAQETLRNQVINSQKCVSGSIQNSIVENLARSGRIQEARDFIDKESVRCFDCARDSRLAIIAFVQAEKGNIEGAREIIDATNEHYRPKFFLSLVEILARAGDIREAKVTLSSFDIDKVNKNDIDLYSSFFSAYGAVIEAQEKTGNLKETRKTLKEMRDYFDKIIPGIMVRSYALSIEKEAFNKCSNVKLYGDVDNFQTAGARWSLYCKVAYLQAVAGDIPGAEETLAAGRQDSFIKSDRFFSPELEADQVYYGMIKSYLKKRNIAQAKTIAKSITGEDVLLKANEDIVQAQVKAGDMKGAEETANWIDRSQFKFKARNLLGRAEAAAKGRLNEAEVFDIYEFIRNKEETDDIFGGGMVRALGFDKNHPPEEVAEYLASYAYAMLQCLEELRQIDAKWKK